MELEHGAAVIVSDWLRGKPEEVFYFITDESHLREAEAFVTAAEQRGIVTKVSVLSSDEVQRGDCVEEMRRIMSYADVVIGATNYSFITTNAVDYALHHGARFLSLPLSTNDGRSMFEYDFLSMNPAAAARMARPMVRRINATSSLRAVTSLGTDLTFSTRGRRAGFFNGTAARAGQCGSASFEVYVPIVETATQGRVVVDGSLGYIGRLEQPLELVFKEGYLVEIGDTPDGRRLKEYLAHFQDPEMYCAAEFGIGLNRKAQCLGNCYIEDESTYGTFHIGLGRNLALGGQHNAQGHFDIVIKAPTLWAGNFCLMEQGEAVRRWF